MKIGILFSSTSRIRLDNVCNFFENSKTYNNSTSKDHQDNIYGTPGMDQAL